MGAQCCDHGHDHVSPTYRRALWIALVVNVAMFLVEIGTGFAAQSVSLLADSVDFLGDAANYGISLFVLGMALQWRARASLLKAASMAAFGLWIGVTTVHHAIMGAVPAAPVMGAIAVLAFAANFAVAAMLYRWRDGDSNMRSVWICTRNDAIGNLAVLAAAAGVFGSGSGWPDYIVAAIMSGLALWGAGQVIVHARSELQLAHDH